MVAATVSCRSYSTSARKLLLAAGCATVAALVVFRLTSKARSKLRLADSELASPGPEVAAAEWYCNVITLARRPFFLVAHSLSLFGVLVPARRPRRRGAAPATDSSTGRLRDPRRESGWPEAVSMTFPKLCPT